METWRVFPTDTSRWSFHRPILPPHAEERAVCGNRVKLKKKKKADTDSCLSHVREETGEERRSDQYIPHILVSGLQTQTRWSIDMRQWQQAVGREQHLQPSQFVRSDPTICVAVGQLRNLVAVTCSHKHCKLLHRLSGYLLFKVYIYTQTTQDIRDVSEAATALIKRMKHHR